MYSLSLELYIALGGSGIQAEEGVGDRSAGGRCSDGEIDIERRISIIAICSYVCAGINCGLDCSASEWQTRRAIILVGLVV